MARNRFKLDVARRDFDCYDCRLSLEGGNSFAWDNTRNCKLCIKCHDKLVLIVGSTSDGSISDETTKVRVYWDSKMLPIKPWEIGNYDINKWPEEIQREYVEVERKTRQRVYTEGFRAKEFNGVTRAVPLKKEARLP